MTPPSDLKHCSACQTPKPLAEFDRNPARRDGVSVYCTPCTRVYFQEVYRARRARDPVGTWAYYAYKSAMARAKRAGVPFAITASLLVSIAPAMCPALGVPLDYTGKLNPTKHGTSPNSPTVDRIIPGRGYVPENIQVLSMRANLIKQDASPEEIAAVAEHYRRVLELHQK